MKVGDGEVTLTWTDIVCEPRVTFAQHILVL